MAINLEKITKKLTGDTVADKKILIEYIDKLVGEQGAFEITNMLGDKLFELILKGGLNEKKYNEERLLSRADDFLYEGKTKEAIELLKAIEAKQDWAMEKDFYFFNNDIEACLFVEQNPTLEKLSWRPSNKNYILYLLASAYIADNNLSHASKTIGKLKKINPVAMDAIILEAKIMPEKEAKKKYDKLLTAFNYAYSYQMLSKIYVELGDILIKTELELALSLYFLAKNILNKTSIEVKFKQALNEYESLNGKKYNIDTESALKTISQYNIPTYFSEKAFDAVCEGYIAYLQNEEASDEGKEFYRMLALQVCNGDEKFVKDLEKIAREK